MRPGNRVDLHRSELGMAQEGGGWFRARVEARKGVTLSGGLPGAGKRHGRIEANLSTRPTVPKLLRPARWMPQDKAGARTPSPTMSKPISQRSAPIRPARACPHPSSLRPSALGRGGFAHGGATGWLCRLCRMPPLCPTKAAHGCARVRWRASILPGGRAIPKIYGLPPSPLIEGIALGVTQTTRWVNIMGTPGVP